MVVIIDYGMGNVRSLYNAMTYLGVEAVISDDPSTIKRASHIILPGVGSFGAAVNEFKTRQLIDVLEEQVLVGKKPFLGICLGLQILAEKSAESPGIDGFGWLKGDVIRIEPAESNLKVPQVGWNHTYVDTPHPLFGGIDESARNFYFVHSYHIVPTDSSMVIGWCDYGGRVVAAVGWDNIVATQFHPEKSHEQGIQFLRNFMACSKGSSPS